MTKLVDVQGLKPCPLWGSGSSPDTGNNIRFLALTTLWSTRNFVTASLANLLILVLVRQVLTGLKTCLYIVSNQGALSLVFSSWVVHYLFIYCLIVLILLLTIKLFYHMTFLTFSHVWSLCYFFPLCYGLLVLTLVLYLIPVSATQYNSLTSSYTQSNFKYVTGIDVHSILVYVVLFLLVINSMWFAPSVSSWFGHIAVNSFQVKMFIFIWSLFLLVSYVEASNSYFSSRDAYDSLVTKVSLASWLSLIFFSNSLITTIFIIEVMSALLFLLITTSIYSTTYYYRNLDFSSYNYFQNAIPYSFLNSLIFFFWVSLISSLNLFLFTIYLYTSLMSLDWYLLEHVYYYYLAVSSYKDLYTLGVTWFIMLFSILLKCGVAPFFLWKPTFFKGLPLNTLFFYITLFYFVLFLFFIHFISSYMFYLTSTYSYVFFLLMLIGILVLLSILFESFFIKSFLAVSSILNSLLVFLALSTTHSDSLLFFM